jgi:glycosyltransferase involved in cell wall biosynthesis
MNLLMISGDRSLLSGKRSAFWYTLEALSKHFERIDIITPKAKDATIDAHNPDALTFFGNVHLYPSPKGLWHQPRWIAMRGAQLISLFHHSVITVHDYPPFYNSMGARSLLRHHTIGSVAEIHHLVGYPTAASLTERIGRFLSRIYLPFSLGRFTAVRVVNKHTAETLASWGVDRRKLAVVPSVYLDHRMFTSLDAVTTPKQFDLGFCARLVPNKGLDQVLRALAKVPHVTLLVIGDGPERAASEKLAQQLDISERVEFRGWLETQEDVLGTLATSKIFVMNSLSEGNPRIAIEAMAAGLPIIATKVGIMPDVVIEGKNGMFTTGEPGDLVAKIIHMLANPALLTSMGNEAKAVRERFERLGLIAKYAEFLQSCAS